MVDLYRALFIHEARKVCPVCTCSQVVGWFVIMHSDGRGPSPRNTLRVAALYFLPPHIDASQSIRSHTLSLLKDFLNNQFQGDRISTKLTTILFSDLEEEIQYIRLPLEESSSSQVFFVSLQNENEHVVLLGCHNVCGNMQVRLQSDILSFWAAVRVCILYMHYSVQPLWTPNVSLKVTPHFMIWRSKQPFHKALSNEKDILEVHKNKSMITCHIL